MVFYSNDHSFGWGGMIFWMIVNALFWGAIIWAIFRLVAGSGSESSSASPDRDTDALAVLKRRYAAGEIEDEEFQRRRQTLMQSH